MSGAFGGLAVPVLGRLRSVRIGPGALRIDAGTPLCPVATVRAPRRHHFPSIDPGSDLSRLRRMNAPTTSAMYPIKSGTAA